ncbi:MAG: hypothetical protein HY046_10605 [Acidobacteria bacterium]|nr:hypothetical protein [Acidobacteriota bacterium]
MSAASDKRDEVRLLINSRYALITVESSEEARLESLLAEVATELDCPFFVWSVTRGLTRRGTDQAVYDTEDPDKLLANIAAMRGDGIFLLKDFVRYFEQDRILRRIRELAESFRNVRRSIFLSAPILKMPPELEDESVSFSFSLPDAMLMQQLVQATLIDLATEIKIKKEIENL